ncbi:MAG: dihydropteroate synthase [Steroidobacteraceae bacterium]
MGVLNATPDSFSDGGLHLRVDAARAAAEEMVAAGAAIIDIGGESTRPGAPVVAVEAELRRVLPIIEALQDLPVLLSVDTSQPVVIRESVARGVAIINDVRALTLPGALEAVASSRVAVCLMHMQGSPQTMQQQPAYRDVVAEVKAFLMRRVQDCAEAGIAPARIAIDPGFGFGKTLSHNLALLRALPEFAALGLPLLAGLSRKSMIGAITGRPVTERLAGSITLAALAAERGARIIRAHDVAQTVDALKLVAALRVEE